MFSNEILSRIIQYFIFIDWFYLRKLPLLTIEPEKLSVAQDSSSSQALISVTITRKPDVQAIPIDTTFELKCEAQSVSNSVILIILQQA